ncbi:MAG: hypothetical protein J6X78_10955 [Treponema sp.]|nr:hypothetical protein [Treponema sp.]
MDDKEYYSLMNRSSSWLLQQTVKKQKNNSTQKKEPSQGAATYASLELRQGKADAEMLIEKQAIEPE